MRRGLRVLVGGCLTACALALVAESAGTSTFAESRGPRFQAPPATVTSTATTTKLDSTSARSQTMEGTITLAGVAPQTSYALVGTFQALTDGWTYLGSYDFSFTSCAGGAASTTEGPEVVGAGGAQPSAPPSSFRGAPTFTTSREGSSMSCKYAVTFTGPVPAPGAPAPVRIAVWVWQGRTLVDHVVGPAVSAPFPPPVAVPEAPEPILLPAVALLILGGALFLAGRRARSTG
jgi:hypothetical protein